MSKKSRTSQKEKRKKAKRALKDARQAQYEAWRKAGQNKKSKRAIDQEKRASVVNDFSHPLGPCGNTGCGPCQGREECKKASCKCGNIHNAA